MQNMFTEDFEKIDLKPIEDIDTSIKNIIGAKMNMKKNDNFVITGRISLTDKYTLEKLDEYDVTFPISIASFKKLGKIQLGKDVNINLISTNYDLNGLSKASLNDVNRLAKNIIILNLRTNANLTEYAFKDLISTPIFYSNWLDQKKRQLKISKVVNALRNPRIDKDNGLFINTLACSKRGIKTYVGITVYKQNDKLRENYEE